MAPYPWWKWLAATLATLMMLTPMACFESYEENPALVRSQAEVTGTATIYAFFAASPEATKHAKQLGIVITEVRNVLQGFPTEGFMALYPEVDKVLKDKLTGDNLVYLPLAELLTQTLLQSLQAQSEKHGWADDTVAATDIVASFLTGADNALAIYAIKAAAASP